MPSLERLAIDLRYLIGLAGFLRHPISVEEAKAIIAEQTARRSETFLDILERAVYANPDSPYAKLLTHAGAELGDVQRGVRVDGLEATLDKLYDAGVYVTSEEMKGRVPIKRNGLEIVATAADFDNPLDPDAHLVAASSGSTGRSTRTRYSLRTVTSIALDLCIGTFARLQGRPFARWSGGEVLWLLISSKLGYPPVKLFFTNPLSFSPNGMQLTVLLHYTRLLSGIMGRPIPNPQIVPRDQALTIARWLADMSARGTPATMMGQSGLRICLAAREHGLDLSGTVFELSGEPYTPAKAATLRQVGAAAFASYAMTEVGGIIAKTCAHSIELDDSHFFENRLALIQREREVAPGASVGALIYTTVHPDNHKLMLNADSGDYATVSTRECPCILGQVGLNTHLHTIRSYEKLTSEGSTFIGSRLYELVEEVLPARFGGNFNDYQLVEEEQPDGVSRISVVVSPRVGSLDEAAVIATIVEELARSHNEPGGAMMVESWRQGGNLRLVRREPYATGARAKVLPLHVLRRSQASLGK